jgi:LPS sulfotransferase NodH
MLNRSWLEPKRLRLRWQQFRQELRRQKSWWLRPHTPYQPLLVLATPRSGSNLLLDFLRQLPGITSHTEVLCPHGPNYPPRRQLGRQQAIRHIRRSLQTLQSPIRGCKLMLHQLANCGVTLTDLDRALPTAKYIVIYRQSLAEQFVSQELAQATQQWLLAPGEQQRQAQVTIDPVSLRRFCEHTQAAYRAALAHPGLMERAVLLSYEELTANPRSCLNERICPLLGLPASDATARTRKQNMQHFSERVGNYAAVAELLRSPFCQQRHVWPGRRATGRQAA